MTVFGLTFEFPVLLISLEIAGVPAVTPQTLGKWRRWAIVAIVVVAGVVTPSSDPFSMLARHGHPPLRLLRDLHRRRKGLRTAIDG